ncbi:hypothetical protein CR513_05579, partial [Mucuna pruriens]
MALKARDSRHKHAEKLETKPKGKALKTQSHSESSNQSSNGSTDYEILNEKEEYKNFTKKDKYKKYSKDEDREILLDSSRIAANTSISIELERTTREFVEIFLAFTCNKLV